MPTFPSSPEDTTRQPTKVPVVKSLCTWAEAYIVMAHTFAVTRSKDPNRVVGSVVTRSDNRVVCMNYNGLAPGQPDTVDFWHGAHRQGCRHAEENALEDIARLPHHDELMGLHLYVSHIPCPDCAQKVAISGRFTKVFYPKVVLDNYRRRGPEKVAEIDLSYRIFHSAGIEVNEVELSPATVAHIAVNMAANFQFIATQKEKPAA